MVQGKEEKVAVLILTALVIVLSLLPATRDTFGLSKGCTVMARLCYPFVHANIFHALANCWCLLSLAFIYNVTRKQLLPAYIIAITFPTAFITGIPIVGMSGMCFALFGMMALRVRRKLYFQFWVLLFLAVGFLFPGAAVWLHLWCYVLGFVFGLLTTPLSMIKR